MDGFVMGDWFTLTVEGEIIDHAWASRPTLDQMQEQVGGYIENLPQARDVGITPFTMKVYEAFANEEGLIHQLPLNSLATEFMGYSIVGNMLVHGVRQA